MSYQSCMWWADLMGWPNGASEQAAERCFDRNSMTTDDPDGGTPEIICNSLDDDCNVLSTNMGGGVKKPMRSKRSADKESSSNYIIIIAIIAVAYLIFKKK